MKTEDWAIEIEASGITKDVALGIGKCLWIYHETLNEVWEKYGRHFGGFGDFLVVLGRLVNHRKEIVETLSE